MKKIPIYMITGLTIFIFGLAIYIMVFGSIAVSQNRLINLFGYSYSVVPTGSMAGDLEDSIQEGDVIIIRLSDYEDVEVGDIVHFYSNDNGFFITHRAIAIDDEGITTQGDAVGTPDTEIVTESMFRGTVVRSFAFFEIGNLLSYRNLIFGLIIIVILLVLIKELYKMLQILRKMQHENYQERLNREKERMIEEEKEKLREELKQEMTKDDAID